MTERGADLENEFADKRDRAAPASQMHPLNKFER